MTLNSSEILLKLDLPKGGQTYLSDKIGFKFWIADPSQSRPIESSDFSYEILCQEVRPSSSSSYMGTVSEVVIFSSEGDGPSFSPLKVNQVDVERGSSYRSLDGKIDSQILEFDGCIQRDLSLVGTFLLRVRAYINGESITSNSVSFSLSTYEAFSGKALGGPLNNIPELYFGKTIILRGWALLLGTEIESVEAIVPHASEVKVQYGLDFKELESSLPDLVECKNTGIEIVAIFDAPQIFQTITFNLRVKFKSGLLQDYYWGATTLDTERKFGLVLSRLEEEGRWIRFEGDLFGASLEDTEFFLVSSRAVKKINSDYINFKYFCFGDEKLDASYFSPGGSSRISLLLPSDFIGTNPGSVNLKIRYCGKNVEVFDSYLKERLSQAFNPRPDYKRGSLPSRVFRWLGGRGLLPVKGIKVIDVQKKEFRSGKVLFVSHNLSLTEGAPKVLYSIIRKVSAKFKSHLVSLREGDARSLLEGVVENIYVVPELDQLGLDVERFKNGTEQAYEIFDEDSPSLVFANGLDSFPLVGVAIERGIKVIWLIHESVDPIHWYAHLPIAIRQRFFFALKNVDQLVFVSERTRILYDSLIKDLRTEVIANGIDASEFKKAIAMIDFEKEKFKMGIGAEEFILLSVGTITERKGQDRTIRELFILKRDNPDLKFKCIFVGAREVPFLWSLRQLVDKLNLQQEVLFVPETADVNKYYAIADCFIINSREESSPLVALEAYASGLPLLSTTVFGLVDLIENGKTALAFDGDREGELAGLILKIINDTSLRDFLKINGNNLVFESYTSERMLEKYQNLIEEKI